MRSFDAVMKRIKKLAAKEFIPKHFPINTYVAKDTGTLWGEDILPPELIEKWVNSDRKEFRYAYLLKMSPKWFRYYKDFTESTRGYPGARKVYGYTEAEILEMFKDSAEIIDPGDPEE